MQCTKCHNGTKMRRAKRSASSRSTSTLFSATFPGSAPGANSESFSRIAATAEASLAKTNQALFPPTQTETASTVSGKGHSVSGSITSK